MNDRRDIGGDDTQRPAWNGPERRTSIETSPIAEEVRALHRSLHGEGTERGVFEQLRSVEKSQGELALRVQSFDHKLDETIRIAKEELRIATEQAARRPPLWMAGSAVASLVSIAAFFLVRLWHEVIGK